MSDLVHISANLPGREGLLQAYRAGIFPMHEPDLGAMLWVSPSRRGVIPLSAEQGLHIPRRLRDRLRSRRFRVTCDAAFEQVIRACAAPRRDDPRSWINEQIIDAYTDLHRAGHAHSIEAWLSDEPHSTSQSSSPIPHRLVGGLYGIHLDGAFFAESKFSRPQEGGTDASKVCLVHLIAHLHRRGVVLLDVQFWTEHLAQFGCLELPRDHYQRELAAALKRPCTWGEFDAEANLSGAQ